MKHNLYTTYPNQVDEYEEPSIVALDLTIGSQMLTNFYRTHARFNSKLINFEQYLELFKGELNCKKTPELIFRASRDGFSAIDFHKQCDDQGKVVIIVKSKTGTLFGGYATETLKLDERGENIEDKESFTFRFFSDRLRIFRLQSSYSKHTLYRYGDSNNNNGNNYLFAFGYFFWIGINANTQNDSGAHTLTKHYILPECILEDINESYFGDISVVEDLEVYKIID